MPTPYQVRYSAKVDSPGPDGSGDGVPPAARDDDQLLEALLDELIVDGDAGFAIGRLVRSQLAPVLGSLHALRREILSRLDPSVVAWASDTDDEGMAGGHLEARVVALLTGGSARVQGVISTSHVERVAQMLTAMAEMFDRRREGRDPGFVDFMSLYGDLVAGEPRDLDALGDRLADRIAALMSLRASLGGRADADAAREIDTGDAIDAVLHSMGLAGPLDELSERLRGAYDDTRWSRRYEFTGNRPSSLGEALEVICDLADVDRLTDVVRTATSPGSRLGTDLDLCVDLERARALIGGPMADRLADMAGLAERASGAGLTEQVGDHVGLTPRAVRLMGARVADELIRQIERDRPDGPRVVVDAHDADAGTRPYEPGDPFVLDLGCTVSNAVRRAGRAPADRAPAGRGRGVALSVSDFEVRIARRRERAAVVMMIDVSLSMAASGAFMAAKKLAIASAHIMSVRHRDDRLLFVAFGETARLVDPMRLAELSWDSAYGTNIAHGLAVSRDLLSRFRGDRRVLMITDGEPTAHLDSDGEVCFGNPPSSDTLDATVGEALACARRGVAIDAVMVGGDARSRAFLDRIARIGGGRLTSTTVEDLAGEVLDLAIEHEKI